jgi:hypothetical protein
LRWYYYKTMTQMGKSINLYYVIWGVVFDTICCHSEENSINLLKTLKTNKCKIKIISKIGELK